MSMPVTSAPARAMASVSRPPPQPMSTSLRPSTGACWRIHSTRGPFMSCSGRKSPCGSHHRDAWRLNASASRGSRFSLAAVASFASLTVVVPSLAKALSLQRIVLVDGRGNSLLPFATAFHYFVFIQRRQFPAVDNPSAADPDVGHLAVRHSVNDLRDHVVNRLGFDPVEPNRRQIGLLADLDAADLVSHAQRAGAVDGGHGKRTGPRDRFRIARRDLGQQGG